MDRNQEKRVLPQWALGLTYEIILYHSLYTYLRGLEQIDEFAYEFAGDSCWQQHNETNARITAYYQRHPEALVGACPDSARFDRAADTNEILEAIGILGARGFDRFTEAVASILDGAGVSR